MEGDWCRFLYVSGLLHHKSHCILPIQTTWCSYRARLKANHTPTDNHIGATFETNNLNLSAYGILSHETQWSPTYDSLACYIPVRSQLDPDFARCRLPHRQMERGWYRFLYVSGLLHHKSHCILPIQTNWCSYRARLKGKSRVNHININNIFISYIKYANITPPANSKANQGRWCVDGLRFITIVEVKKYHIYNKTRKKGKRKEKKKRK